MRRDALGKPLGNDLGDLFNAGRAQLRDASKIPQQFLSDARTDSGNILQPRMNGAFAAPLPVKADDEAVRFVANLLDQMKDRGMMLQPDRLVFLAQNVNNFFLFRNAGDGLVDDFEFFERPAGGGQLADP